MQAFRARLKRIKRGYVGAIDRFYPQLVINARYSYQLDAVTLEAVMSGLDSFVDSILLEGGTNQLWFFDEYVRVAYERGTLQEFTNLSRQSTTYAAARESMLKLTQTEPYRARIALIRAREFEEMKGLAGNVKANMGRVLTDGMARGLGTAEIARNLTEQTGIEETRANRIARTEIPTALRRARMDEADDARETMNLRTLEMHQSALSPTTRVTHAQRHGKLFTTDQQRQWWSEGANSINCYVPGTRVQGRFIAGSKAKYRGDVIKVVTASGRELTVTPNHPIATSAGLKAAKLLRKGDYALAYGVKIENPIGVGALHDDQIDARVESVFSALVQVGHAFARRVEAVDFHGDAQMMDVDIEVVGAEGFLPCDDEAEIAQALDNIRFEHANTGEPHRLGASGFSVIGIDGAAPGLMGGSGHALAVSGAVSTVPVECASTAVASVNTMLTEDSPDYGAGDAEATGQRLLTFPAGVTLDQIVFVDVLQFSGHVYDLEEKSGLMVANGIIASNCKCTTISVMVDAKGEPLVPAFVENSRAAFKAQAEKENMPWAKDL